MANNLRAAHITQRRRPIDDKYEIVCMIVDFYTQTYESMMMCDEILEIDAGTPMTPTKPTVLTGTNAPERPKRQDVFTFDF